MFDPINFALMGGADVTVVDLDEWGITPVALTLMGQGGGAQKVDIDHQKFWNRIKPAKIVSVEFTMPGSELTKNKLFVTSRTYNYLFGGIGAIAAYAIMSGMLCSVEIGGTFSNAETGGATETTVIVGMYPLTATEVTS